MPKKEINQLCAVVLTRSTLFLSFCQQTVQTVSDGKEAEKYHYESYYNHPRTPSSPSDTC